MKNMAGWLLSVVIIVMLLVVLFGGVLPIMMSTVEHSRAQTISGAIALLRGNGYFVFATTDCFPNDFEPCDSGVQSLGSDGNRWKDLWLSSATIYLGDVTIRNSGTQIDIDGQLVLHDGGKVWLEIQPDLDYGTIEKKGKPTLVNQGVHTGFSLPVFGDDDEELYVSIDVPREWDGVTNPIIHIHAYTLAPDGAWMLPIGHNDLGGWIDETLAYDDGTGTYSYADVNPSSWSNFLEFTIDDISSDNVLFYAKYDLLNIDSIDIDAYYNGSWHNIYEGVYDSMAWVVKPLGGTYTLSATRVRFHNIGAGIKDARLYEFQVSSTTEAGRFNLEMAWDYYSPIGNDILSDTSILTSMETVALIGEYVTYQIEMPLNYDENPANPLTVCDQLSLRVRRIAASSYDLSEEIVVTHIGIQFLRDKLGTITPNGE